MEINFTLVVQMLVFATFVWFTMRFVWPPLVKAMQERQNKIAEGLQASERAYNELALVKVRVANEIKQAKHDASKILDEAKRHAAEILDDAKKLAREETQRQADIVQREIEQNINSAKRELNNYVADFAVRIAEKILMHEINEKISQQLVDKVIEDVN